MDAQKIIEAHRKAGLDPPLSSYLASKCGISEAEAVALIAGHGTVAAEEKPVQVKAQKTRPAQPMAEVKPETVKPSLPHRTMRERVQAGLLALLPFIFAGASVAGSIRSYSLCREYFVRFNSNDAAVVMALMLVAMAFAMPQAVVILWDHAKRGKRRFLFFVSVIISIGTIGTNVLITAKELDSQKSDTQTVGRANHEKREQLESRLVELETIANDIREMLELDKAERIVLLEAQKGLEVGTSDYNRTRSNLATVKERIDAQSKELASISQDTGLIRQELATIPVDAVAGERTIIDTVIMYGSAILIEVGSPLCLSISLFL